MDEDRGSTRSGCDDTELTNVVVAVCTYRRNEQLRRLLEGVVESAGVAADRSRTGIVVVDDSPERGAESVVRDFADRLPLGVHYRVSGHQNISLARNVGLETALEMGDWLAMTDDDCVPHPRWLREFLDTQARTGAGAVSGRLVRRAPIGAPDWFADQRFLQQGLGTFDQDADLSMGSTHNSMLSTAWLRAHAEVRFDPELGRLGGEDMLFFRTAHAKGLRIVYAKDAVVYEDQEADRLRFRFLLRNSLWLGNSTFVTCVSAGQASPPRMAVHGLGTTGRALVHPLVHLVRGQRPEFRYNLVRLANGLGTLLGAIGVRISHH